jgi:hypothetical protein
LIPPVRRFVRIRLVRKLQARIVRIVSPGQSSAASESSFRESPIVDVESQPPQA